MNLNIVISELRAELETVKQVTAALEQLYEIRSRRESSEQEEEEEEAPRPRKRLKAPAGSVTVVQLP